MASPDDLGLFLSVIGLEEFRDLVLETFFALSLESIDSQAEEDGDSGGLKLLIREFSESIHPPGSMSNR